MSKEKAPRLKKSDETLILTEVPPADTDVKTVEDLKKLLTSIRDRLAEGTCPPVFALGTLTHVLGISHIYQILNEENREIARSIWFSLKQKGLQVKAPPLLFDSNESDKDGLATR